MADEPEVVEKETQELADAIGEEGTLAHLQRNVPRVRFDAASESLVEDKPETPPESPTEKPEEKVEGKPEETASPEEKPEEKPVEGKFKSKEDAEKAHAEAERKMHEATTKAAEAEKAKLAAEKEREELQKKLEEALAKPPEKPEEKQMPAADRKAAIREATKNALETIRGLDRDDDDYDSQVEEAWASALIEVGMGSTPFTQAEIDKMVKESLKADKEAEKAAAAEKEKQEAGERAWNAAIEQGKKAGLKLDQKDSADWRIFDSIERDFARDGLPEELQGKPLTEIVDWMIDQTKKLTGNLIEQTDAQREAAKKAQIKNQVLTTGGKSPPPVKEQETYTLAELQRQMREKAQARHRGA
jgi:hypothetical protein